MGVQCVITDCPCAWYDSEVRFMTLVRLVNEQINRFVFDIVRSVLEHPVRHCSACRSETDDFSLSFGEGATLTGMTGLCGYREQMNGRGGFAGF